MFESFAPEGLEGGGGEEEGGAVLDVVTERTNVRDVGVLPSRCR